MHPCLGEPDNLLDPEPFRGSRARAHSARARAGLGQGFCFSLLLCVFVPVLPFVLSFFSFDSFGGRAASTESMHGARSSCNHMFLGNWDPSCLIFAGDCHTTKFANITILSFLALPECVAHAGDHGARARLEAAGRRSHAIGGGARGSLFGNMRIWDNQPTTTPATKTIATATTTNITSSSSSSSSSL